MRACCAGGSTGRSAGNAIGGGVWFGESHCKTFGAGTSAPNENAHAKLAARAMAALGGKFKLMPMSKAVADVAGPDYARIDINATAPMHCITTDSTQDWLG